MIDRMLGGEAVLALLLETRVPKQTLHRRKHQALIDAGRVEGVDSTQNGELRAAEERITALEEEPQLVKEASALFHSLAVVDPKERTPSQKNS
jgi:hypothetical protein